MDRTMAEGDASPPKRIKLDALSILPKAKMERLRRAMDHLENDWMQSVWLLKINLCNASYSKSFTNASCEVVRSADDASHKLYSFSSIFESGFLLLNSYFKDELTENLEQCEVIALKRLVMVLQTIEGINLLVGWESRQFIDKTTHRYSFLRQFIDTIEDNSLTPFEDNSSTHLCEDVGNRLGKESCNDRQPETVWTFKLVHHLLRHLSVNQSYIVDENAACKPAKSKCPCCDEELTGKYGDTSMGNIEVWHGSVDILLGSENVAIEVAEFNVAAELEESLSSFEVKTSENLKEKHRQQLLSEAIVFACLQKQRHPESFHCLIPTIRIARKKVAFYFYDPEFDILLESAPIHLFAEEDHGYQMPYSTVLALWLAINYKHLSSGVTEAMVDNKEYKAGFLDCLSEESKYIYTNQLRLGNCRFGREQGEYVPRAGDLYDLVKSKPMKKKDKKL